MSLFASSTPPPEGDSSRPATAGSIGATPARDPPAAAATPPPSSEQPSRHLTVHAPPSPSALHSSGGGIRGSALLDRSSSVTTASHATTHETLLLQAQAQVRDLLPYKERALQLQSDVRVAHDRVQQQEAQIAALEALARRERARADAQALEASAAMERESQELRDELTRERRRGEAWRDERDRLQRTVEELESAHSDRVARLQASVSELETSVDRHHRRDAQAAALREDLVNTERRLVQTAEDAENYRRRASKLEQELTQCMSQKASALERLGHAEAEAREVPALKTAVADGERAAAEVKSLQTEVDALQVDIRRLRTGETELKDALERQRRRAAALEEDLHVAVTERAEKDAQLQELLNVRRDYTDTLRQLTRERDTTTELRALLQEAQAEMEAAARASHAMLREMADEAEALVATAARSSADVIDDASPIRAAGDATNTSAGARILHSHALQHQQQPQSSSASATMAIAASGAVRSRPQSPSRDQTHNAAASVNASLSQLRQSVERLTSALREQRAANMELLRVESDCRSTISDLESRLRAATRDASDRRVEAARAQQEAHDARHDAEDLATDARRARRKAADLAAKVQRACSDISGTYRRSNNNSATESASASSPVQVYASPVSKGTGSPSRHGFPATSAHDSSQSELTTSDLAGVVDAGERALSRIVAFATALLGDNERLADKLEAQAHEFGEERRTLLEQTRADAATHREAMADAERAQAALKESLSRAVVRHDEAVAARAGFEHDLDRLRTRFAELEHEAATLRTEKDSLRERADTLEQINVHEQERTQHEARKGLELHRKTEELESALGRTETQRDNVRVMLGCSVAAISRLRCDLRELLLQRRLMQSWTRELEDSLHAIRATCVDEPQQGGDVHAKARVARFTGRPLKGLARFRIAALAVLVANRLRFSVAPHDVYSGGAPLASAGIGFQRRPRFRSTAGGQGFAASSRPPLGWQSNVSILARAVPVPATDDLLACVSVDGTAVADAVVEGLLKCFAVPTRLSMPPAHGTSLLPAPQGLSEELASPERCRPDPRLLQQLQGTDVDLTMLRRLNAGQCAIPVNRSVGTPVAASRDVCAAVRDALRKTGQALNDANAHVHKLRGKLARSVAEHEECERRATEYARRLSEATIGHTAAKRKQMVDASAHRHQEEIERAEAAAERRRADAAVAAEVARREAARRDDERMRIENDRKAAAAVAASFDAMSRRSTATPSMRRRGSDASLDDSLAGGGDGFASGRGSSRVASPTTRSVVGESAGRRPHHNYADPTRSSEAKRADASVASPVVPVAATPATQTMMRTASPRAGLNRSTTHQQPQHSQQPPAPRTVPVAQAASSKPRRQANISPLPPTWTSAPASPAAADVTGAFDTSVLELLDSIDARLSHALRPSSSASARHGPLGAAEYTEEDDAAESRAEKEERRRRRREERRLRRLEGGDRE